MTVPLSDSWDDYSRDTKKMLPYQLHVKPWREFLLLILKFLVHGGLSEWSEWGSCDVTCGKGSQLRTRKCDSPKPICGGRNCTALGSLHETREFKAVIECPSKSCSNKQICFSISLVDYRCYETVQVAFYSILFVGIFFFLKKKTKQMSYT